MGQNLDLLKYVGGVWFVRVYSQGGALGAKGTGGIYKTVADKTLPPGHFEQISRIEILPLLCSTSNKLPESVLVVI